MKELVLMAITFVSMNIYASESLKVYGTLNFNQEYSEIASSDSVDSQKNEYVIQGNGFGAGAEFFLNQIMRDRYSISLGLYYEFQRKLDLVAGYASGAVAVSANNPPKAQHTSLYTNLYIDVGEYTKVFGGLNYNMVSLSGRGSLEMNPGLGLQLGIDFSLPGGMFVQPLYRSIRLDTDANNNYNGSIDLSAFYLNVGRNF